MPEWLLPRANVLLSWHPGHHPIRLLQPGLHMHPRPRWGGPLPPVCGRPRAMRRVLLPSWRNLLWSWPVLPGRVQLCRPRRVRRALPGWGINCGNRCCTASQTCCGVGTAAVCCAAGERCEGGRCVAGCPDGGTACGNTCCAANEVYAAPGKCCSAGQVYCSGLNACVLECRPGTLNAVTCACECDGPRCGDVCCPAGQECATSGGSGQNPPRCCLKGQPCGTYCAGDPSRQCCKRGPEGSGFSCPAKTEFCCGAYQCCKRGKEQCVHGKCKPKKRKKRK